MITRQELLDLLIFDIETVSFYPTFAELEAKNPKLAELWVKKYKQKYKEEVKEYVGDETLSEYFYKLKAGLHPEFAKPVSISFASILPVKIKNEDGTDSEKESDQLEIKVFNMSIKNDDEKGLLERFVKFLNNYKMKNLAGFNIINFDIPFVAKRLLVNGIQLPSQLRIHNLKPWEVKTQDLVKYYQFGSYDTISFDLLTNILGVESPKNGISGENVGEYYWEKKDITTIAEYCNKDVKAVGECFLKLSKL